MNPLEKFEHAVGKFFRSISARPGQNPEPVEIRRAALREIADQVRSKGGGEYFFPYTFVKVELSAPDDASRATLEAIFEPHRFAQEVEAELSDRGCRVAALDVQVEVMPASETQPAAAYRIVYGRTGQTGYQAAKPRPEAVLTVVEGQADVKEVKVDRDLIYIGRLKEVVSTRTGLDRRNVVAFDASEVTVSRKHARLEY